MRKLLIPIVVLFGLAISHPAVAADNSGKGFESVVEAVEIDPAADLDAEEPLAGCWFCTNWIEVPGHLDTGCFAICAVACGGLSGGAYYACVAGCSAACWVPGYTYCEEWIYSSVCPALAESRIPPYQCGRAAL